MAPLAPMFGIVASGRLRTSEVTNVCAAVAARPPSDVEDKVAEPAERVLDVVAEDPEKEHVAEQVRPARRA